MLYHSRGLPGYLALLSSSDAHIYTLGLSRLVRDHTVYQAARAKAIASTFIAKLVRTSPFQQRLVREIALMATEKLDGFDESDRRHKFQKFVYYMFMGWG